MLEKRPQGNSLTIQWLRFLTFTAEGLGLIPGQETTIPQAPWYGGGKKKKTTSNFITIKKNLP